MDIKLELEDEEPNIEVDQQSTLGCDVSLKVLNSSDAHVDYADHAYEFPHLEKNFVDSCVGAQDQSLNGTSRQYGVCLFPKRFSTESPIYPIYSDSQNFVNVHGYFTKNRMQVPQIHIQNSREKVKQIIQTQIEYENHQAARDCINILENIFRNDIFTLSEKEAHLVLNKATLYKRNFVCNVCFEYFPATKILSDHKLFFHRSVIKPFTWNKCDSKFTKASFLKTYKLTHHSEKLSKSTLKKMMSTLQLRLTGRHFIEKLPLTEEKTKSVKRCLVCSSKRKRRESRYHCRQCNVTLCIQPCFEIYHTKENYAYS